MFRSDIAALNAFKKSSHQNKTKPATTVTITVAPTASPEAKLPRPKIATEASRVMGHSRPIAIPPTQKTVQHYCAFYPHNPREEERLSSNKKVHLLMLCSKPKRST